ncbi:hypothetical protein EPI10_010962 [Gossypium australe]|uniref:G-patch domain-containing protein n=1 Tax=Gossypium australe TaxID=47621 RepID=A0A5B6W6X2_9ROSI|nr:hypothetical protein EPI10_010962 [Gossypium australe]
MEKKQNESFRQYAQRWREVAMQVQPLLLEKETTMLFINTLKAPFINHMLGSATKSFSDIVMSGEMIENTVKSDKIDAGESAKRSAPRKKKSEINNVGAYNKGYSKPITAGLLKTITTSFQAPPRRESNQRLNAEKLQFTPIPMTYKELYQSLFDAHVISPFYLKSMQPPYPKWYNANAQYEYHAGITRHLIENCTAFKKSVERLIKMGIVKFDDQSNAENPLPNHADKGVNATVENAGRKIKMNIAEIKTPMREVLKKMGLMDNKELGFFEYAEEVEDSKKVLWNYDCNVTISREESSISASKEGREVGFYTRSGKCYAGAEPVKGKTPMAKQKGEKTVSVVEQLHKQSARISVLALLLSSEVHRDTLMKVLNETYVANDISVNKLDRLVNNISADNFIFFNDDEIPPRGMGSTKALHITTRCKGYTLPGVLIDNGSALNVLPLSTLNRLPVHSSHMKTCQNIVRAFDGTERRVMGRIEIPLLIGPNTYEVDFLVMNIKPSYNCLLGRPWIHTAGAVPSSLHQKLKLVADGRLITINAEEDIIASVTSNAPYVGTDNEVLECSFRSLEFVNTTFIVERNKIPMPRISKTTKMGLQLTVGKGALPGRGLGRCLQGKAEAPMLKDKRDRYSLGFKPDARQRKKEIEKKQERRRARLSGGEIEWEQMTFPHISKSFISGGTIHPDRKMPRKETAEEMLRSLSINAISEKGIREENLSNICPYVPGSILNNWTAEEIFVNINDMSDITTDSESPFKQDLCMEDSQDLEDVRNCSLSLNLLRMVEQDEKQILPHKESMEIVSLGDEKEVKIEAYIVAETKQDLIELL